MLLPPLLFSTTATLTTPHSPPTRPFRQTILDVSGQIPPEHIERLLQVCKGRSFQELQQQVGGWISGWAGWGEVLVDARCLAATPPGKVQLRAGAALVADIIACVSRKRVGKAQLCAAVVASGCSHQAAAGYAVAAAASAATAGR